MICLNCGNFIFDWNAGKPDVPELNLHIQPQIDCITGESFIPVARVVNDQVTDLWSEDYICQKKN